MQKRSIKSGISLFLCLSLSVAAFFSPLINITAYAVSYPCFAVIANTRNGTTPVYSMAGTTGHEADEANKGKSQVLDNLAEGVMVKVLGTEADGDGDIWYKVQYGSGYTKSGYVYTARATLKGDYSPDADFEAWLTSQNFPESYKPGLRSLHALYPNWVFYADHTNIDYNTAVLCEYNSGYKAAGKYAAASRDESWKSMAEGYYNWSGDNAGTYNFTEGSSWVKASKGVISYYMDPRNFFDTTSVFMFFTLSYTAGTVTAEDVQKAAKGTFMEGNLPDNPEKSYASVILEAAELAKLNPYVMVGLFRQEQGSQGQGTLISGTYPGYEGIYNYFNIGAYEHDGMSVAQSGLWWANGAGKGYTTYRRPWNTREKAIKGGAEYYVEKYIAVGQDTLYYQNFNVYKNTKYDLYTHQYATNIEDSVGKAAGYAGAYADINDSDIVFHIPVYNNMPDKTVLPPKGTNNNCYLNSLSVTGFEMEPFERYKNSYELVVPFAASSVEIVAEKSDSGASVSGAGVQSLQVGINSFDITVTASSGEVNVYNLKISRQSGSGEVSPPTLNTGYKTDGFLSGITPGTSVEQLKSNLGVQNGTVKVLNASGDEKNSGNTATGDIVYVYDMNNQVAFSYGVVIYGDINGDGKITSVDLLVGQRHILGISVLSGAQLEAADIDHNRNISSVDLLVGQRHILNIKAIVQ